MRFKEWLAQRNPQLADQLKSEGLLDYLGRSKVGKYFALSPLYLSLAANMPKDSHYALNPVVAHAKEVISANRGGKRNFAKTMDAISRRRQAASRSPGYQQPVPTSLLVPER